MFKNKVQMIVYIYMSCINVYIYIIYIFYLIKNV